MVIHSKCSVSFEDIQRRHYPEFDAKPRPAFGVLGRIGSFFYTLGLHWVQRSAYQRLQQAQAWPLPVISVGNLTTGGTGKTPVTRAIAQFLEAQGLTPVVLSRGYKASYRLSGERVSHPDQGDEPFMLAQSLTRGGVRVGKNRVVSARKAIEEDHADVLLLDDGYQNLAFPRTLNILLVDGQLGFGNGYMLPAGPLREPVAAIERADVVLLTKDVLPRIRDMVLSLCEATGRAIPVYDCPFEMRQVLPETGSVLMPLPVESSLLLLSGVAQPDYFQRCIQAVYPQLHKSEMQFLSYPDHHRYTQDDICAIQADLRADSMRILVTTQKDWVKLSQFEGWPLDRIRVFEIQAICDWERVLASVLEARTP
jgi:tetraacyldisaccharide 4'-kinase